MLFLAWKNGKHVIIPDVDLLWFLWCHQCLKIFPFLESNMLVEGLNLCPYILMYIFCGLCGAINALSFLLFWKVTCWLKGQICVHILMVFFSC